MSDQNAPMILPTPAPIPTPCIQPGSAVPYMDQPCQQPGDGPCAPSLPNTETESSSQIEQKPNLKRGGVGVPTKYVNFIYIHDPNSDRFTL